MHPANMLIFLKTSASDFLFVYNVKLEIIILHCSALQLECNITLFPLAFGLKAATRPCSSCDRRVHLTRCKRAKQGAG